MTEQSNERIEADNALRAIARRADNRLECDSYDLGYYRGEAGVIKIYFDHDPALAELADAAINRLRDRSSHRVA